MFTEDWPPLQESDIQALATAKVFTRGRALFDEGALEDLTRQGEQLSALCQGSEDESYTVSARINEHGIQSNRCTCPYDYDGVCKHLVALLLAWAHGPEAFLEVEDAPLQKGKESPLLLELKGRERDDLARLIVQLVETEPKLRPIVRSLLKNRLSDSEVVKTRRAIEALMRKVARFEYESDFSQIRRDLLFHLRIAANFEAHRPSDAGRLYIAILQGLMVADSGVFSWDSHGHLASMSQQCVAALEQLLPRVSAALRAEWLKVLCQAYLFEISLDGYNFAEGADAVLESAGPEEWKLIESQLDEFLKPKTVQKSSRNAPYGEWLLDDSSWLDHRRESVIELKARLLAKFEGPQAARDFLLDQGTPAQKVDTYLADEDLDAATHIARQSFLGSQNLILSFANKLNDAGQWERAREWAQQNNLTQWLAQHTALRGDPDALQLNIELFRAKPTLHQWFEVMQLAPASSLDELKAELWEQLEKKAAHATQFDIRLRENDVAAALKLWSRLSNWERANRYEQLANAAETSHADEAFLLWNELAESFIDQRDRGNYRLAAKALTRAKNVLEKEKRGKEWEEWIAALRARYPKLRALQEELDRAKL